MAATMRPYQVKKWGQPLAYDNLSKSLHTFPLGFYSPSPEYPVACRSEAEIPPSGATGMNGVANRAEAVRP